jgi:hypothetical protein
MQNVPQFVFFFSLNSTIKPPLVKLFSYTNMLSHKNKEAVAVTQRQTDLVWLKLTA